jgi:hypothetical protein
VFATATASADKVLIAGALAERFLLNPYGHLNTAVGAAKSVRELSRKITDCLRVFLRTET